MSRRTHDQLLADHVAQAGSGPHDGPRCACRHDGLRWLRMCKAAQAASDALHNAAQYQHRFGIADELLA